MWSFLESIGAVTRPPDRERERERERSFEITDKLEISQYEQASAVSRQGFSHSHSTCLLKMMKCQLLVLVLIIIDYGYTARLKPTCA